MCVLVSIDVKLCAIRQNALKNVKFQKTRTVMKTIDANDYFARSLTVCMYVHICISNILVNNLSS